MKKKYTFPLLGIFLGAAVNIVFNIIAAGLQQKAIGTQFSNQTLWWLGGFAVIGLLVGYWLSIQTEYTGTSHRKNGGINIQRVRSREGGVLVDEKTGDGINASDIDAQKDVSFTSNTSKVSNSNKDKDKSSTDVSIKAGSLSAGGNITITQGAGDITELKQLLAELLADPKRNDKQYFEQFIQPAWEVFNRIHEDYKRSFRDYSLLFAKSIAKEEINLAPIIHQIRQDSVYTSDLRSQLWGIMYLQSSNDVLATDRNRKAHLLDFIASIGWYFDAKDIEVKNLKKRDLEAFVPKEFLKSVDEKDFVVLLSATRAFHNGPRLKALTYLVKHIGKDDLNGVSNVHGIFDSILSVNIERDDLILESSANEMFDLIIADLQGHYHYASRTYFMLKNDFLA